MHVATIIRRIDFNAAHQLYSRQLSESENQALFGKCANPHFHGHNYTVWVSLRGPIDPVTGMVFNLGDLKRILKREVEDYLDHKNLNLEVDEFRELVPTAENIARVIHERLERHLGELLHGVRLQETPRNIVEYRTSSSDTRGAPDSR